MTTREELPAEAVFSKYFLADETHPRFPYHNLLGKMYESFRAEQRKKSKLGEPTRFYKFGGFFAGCPDTIDLDDMQEALKADWREIRQEAWKFERRAFGAQPYLYKPGADVSQLTRLRSTLAKLQIHVAHDLSDSAMHRLRTRMFFGAYTPQIPVDEPYELSMFLLENGITDNSAGVEDELLHQVRNVGEPLEAAFDDFLASIPALLTAIDNTISDIQTSPRARGGPPPDLKSVQFVEAARIAWQENTNKGIPQGELNGASPFGKYLSDLFDAYYDTSRDIRPAFRAWRKLYGDQAQKFAEFQELLCVTRDES